MKKTNTVRVNGNVIFKGHKLTIGMDLGDHWSCFCVLDEAGEILLEQKVATTPEAMKQVFAKIPQSLIAMETGTHSPWVSRLLTELGYKVIVAHAQKVQLITKSNRKDDRHDARTLARLARIDAELLGPVRHRSAQAQIHLTVIRARAELVRARTALVNAARGLVKSYGQRLPKCGTQQVNRELAAGLHAELREVLEPLLKEIEPVVGEVDIAAGEFSLEGGRDVVVAPADLRPDEGLGEFPGRLAADALHLGDPQRQRLVAPRGGAEPQRLVVGELFLEGVLAVLECVGHVRLPRRAAPGFYRRPRLSGQVSPVGAAIL